MFTQEESKNSCNEIDKKFETTVVLTAIQNLAKVNLEPRTVYSNLIVYCLHVWVCLRK